MNNTSTPNKVVKQGLVTSDAMDKTIVVTVSERFRHPLYFKTVQKSKRYKAHDEKNRAKVGDTVEIVETRPISRDKHWRLTRILKRDVLAS